MRLKETSLPLLRHMASTSTFPLNYLCRRGSASTAGILVPRRGKEDAFEKQEASDYVEHDILNERFHVNHYAGCAILFNKDTFYLDISVKSIYLHDTWRGVPDQVVEGEQGWVLQGVLSRASFRRAAATSQKLFTVLSLHISNIYVKKLILTLRANMISQEVDLVAGDFNGTAWRCRSRDNLSTIDEAFADCALPSPPGPTPYWLAQDQMIKAAIMRHGFTFTSSIGTTNGPDRHTTTEASA